MQNDKWWREQHNGHPGLHRVTTDMMLSKRRPDFWTKQRVGVNSGLLASKLNSINGDRDLCPAFGLIVPCGLGSEVRWTLSLCVLLLLGNNALAKYLCLTSYRTSQDPWRNSGGQMYEALKQIVESIRRQMRWVNYLELINIVNTRWPHFVVTSSLLSWLKWHDFIF